MAANASRRDVLRYALGATVAAVAGPAALSAPQASATGGPGGPGDSANVKDYGAVGDGVANDRAAIHAARDAAGEGGTLVFPNGTYKVQTAHSTEPGFKYGSGGLHANVAGQTWLLGSAELILAGWERDNLITISATNVSIVGGTLDLSGIPPDLETLIPLSSGVAVWSGTVATGVVYGAHGSAAAGAVIREMRINDAPGHGIHILNTDSVTVTGCTAKDFFKSGITVQNENSTDIHDFLIHGNRLESKWASLAAPLNVGANDQPLSNFDAAVMRVRRARVTNNSCVIPRNLIPGGLDTGAIQMFNAEDCVIDGNITDGGAMGITTGFLRRTVISGNTCSGWRGIGIEVSGGLDDVTVIGNVLDSDGAGGPFDAVSGAQSAAGSLKKTITGILSSGDRIFSSYTIAGNTITGFTTPARAAGLMLYNSSRPASGGTFEGVKISDNSITAGGGSQKFSGLLVYAPTTNLTITGNTIDGASSDFSSGIEIAESTHVGVLITGNTFSNCSVAAFSPHALTNGGFTNISFTGNLVRNCGAVIKEAPPR